MIISWVRIRSWHAVKVTEGPSADGRTLCGRTYPNGSLLAPELPADKSCETCLRIVARKADA
jgi:hypothetical protein